jgi:glycosyltransferase involved in cell wall biosynthesis/SAM-dependent methyltransferase
MTLKISWFSNAPFASTGYGCQTRLTVPRLQALGHELQVTAFYGLEGAVITIPGPRGPIPVYPRGYHPYGADVWSAHAAHFGADVCISLMDAWVFQPEQNPEHVPWVPYFPVDMEPLPPPIRRQVERAQARIVMSKFGGRMLDAAGLDYYYIPHMVDTNTYRPRVQAEARTKIGLPADAFLVGMVAANKGNPSRKAFQQQIEAFAAFRRRHSDAVLYLHTTRSEHGEGQGINLPELVRYLGLRDGVDVLWPDQYLNMLGYPDEHMAQLYSAFDVHMLVSMGEGFGIPTLEAQSCGCPVITAGWTASEELCFSGWRVDKTDAQPWWTPLASYQYVPHPGAIVERLEAAYNARGDLAIRRAARDGALAYDCARVVQEGWKPVLEHIEAGLKAPQSMRATFSGIYARDQWGNGSGPGSSMRVVKPYIAYLEQFLREHEIKSVLDVGCGDWQFSKTVDWGDAEYLGVDVVESVIHANEAAYGSEKVSFWWIDAFDADLPAADLLILKDVLQHWSNAEILAFLPRLANYRYVLITNCYGAENADITTGDYRPLDITRAPFNLPATQVLSFGQEWDKRVFLWTRAEAAV